MLTARDHARVWINGKYISWPRNNGKWNIAQNYTFEGHWKVMAVTILGIGLRWGFVASFSDGSVTSATSGWKCTVKPLYSFRNGYQYRYRTRWSGVDFDDNHWQKADEFNATKVDGIDRKAKWIRKTVLDVGGILSCRRKF